MIPEEGDGSIVEPVQPTSLLAALARLAPLDEEFPPIGDAPPDAVEL